jgi:DNA-binding CsgD family transcriptional regulator
VRRLSESEKSEIWARFEAGESLRSISRRLGRPPSTIRTHVVSARFRRPLPAVEWSPLRLSLTEREEISRGLAAGESLRQVARRLGRAASTVSREVAANGGRGNYRAARPSQPCAPRRGLLNLDHSESTTDVSGIESRIWAAVAWRILAADSGAIRPCLVEAVMCRPRIQRRKVSK